MIPRLLRLKNFLSFSDSMQALDFDQFRVACMVGNNGAGKSSLIEAISWCVWGKGRAKSSELMHEGSLETRVEYEFNLQETRYKIIRILKRKQKGSPTESLEFQVFNSAQSDFIPLTEPSKTATQNKILQFVGITYEVFMNSAFIVQGRADEFSLKHPNQRKDILIKILQIDRYNALSEMAQKKALEITKEISKTSGKIETLREELLQMEPLKSELKENKLQLEQVSKTLEDAQTRFLAAEKQHEEIRRNAFENEKNSDRLAFVNNHLSEIKTQRESRLQNLAEIETLLKNAPNLETEKKSYDRLQTEIVRQEALLAEAREFDESIRKLEQQYLEQKLSIDAKITVLEQTLSRLSSQQRQIEDKVKVLEIALEAEKEINQKLSAFASLEKDIQANAKIIESLKDKEASLRHQIGFLKNELEEITGKGQTIKTLKEPTCPLCKSPLNDTHKTHILEEYRKDYKEKKYRLGALEKEFALTQEEARSLKTKESELRDKKEVQIKLEQELAVLEHRKREFEELASEKIKVVSEKENSQKELLEFKEGNAPESHILETLKNEGIVVRKKIEELGYDEKQHQALQEQFKALSHVPQKLFELEHARENQKKINSEILVFEEKAKDLQDEKNKLEQALKSLETILIQKDEIEREFLSSKENLSLTQRRQSDLEYQKRQVEEKIQALEQKKEALKAFQESVKENTEQREIYDFLKIAFGVTGIQSLIIENAVPELEAHANQLLAKLTQNQMSLVLKTQRQLATKEKSVESLEIEISDGTGTIREYNTFSGGERFRIDLALRIALSKLLAAQSGVSVKMLIIDEGFGTQDEEGLEVIVDAIDRISDEFEKIIMITHLEKLRDAFEVKINVKKEAGVGSQFSVSTAS